MEYNFYKEIIDEVITFGVMPKSAEIKILFRFGNNGWTPPKVQAIINGIESSKTKPKGQEYIWANEDVRLYSNENAVVLIDDLAARGGEEEPDNLYLKLTHLEMLTFLQDFKQFVEDNQ